jgi:hypothetical protein
VACVFAFAVVAAYLQTVNDTITNDFLSIDLAVGLQPRSQMCSNDSIPDLIYQLCHTLAFHIATRLHLSFAAPVSEGSDGD